MAVLHCLRIVTQIAIALHVLPPGAGSTQFSIGHPTNITRHAGDKNVYIPCPFGGPAAVTWRIGDHFYSQSTLPEPYTYVPGGIIIRVITTDMSGLSFQCFTPLNDGLYDIGSSTGVLTVKATLFVDPKDDNLNKPRFTPFHPQPTNLTVDVREKNVFIPCPFGGPAIHTWKIGDHFYTTSTLPQYYHSTVGGLIISSLSNNMSGLTFQCFTPNGTGLYVDESTVGTLTVTDHYSDSEIISSDEPSDCTDECDDLASLTSTTLCLDYQNFWFMDSTVTFAWKFNGQPCDSHTLFFINSTECVIAHQSHNTNKQYYSRAVMEKKATIPRHYLIDDMKKLMYFLISVGSNPNSDACDNVEIPSYITVSKRVFTETYSTTPYNKACINLPPASISRGALRFALPYRNASDPIRRDHCDLICLAECHKSTTLPNGCCAIHNMCSPVALEDTIYSGSVTLCKKNMTEMFQLCFTNPTPEMNETKIHLYYERTCTNALTSKIIVVAEYVKAVVLNITVPPPPPNVSVTLTSGEICIISQMNERFPADYYKIVITDVTGYEIFKNDSIWTTCITVSSLLQHECSPFNISVVGHNIYGDSSPTFHVVDAGFNQTTWCDCANMKVNLTLDYITQTRSVKYNYACSVFNGFDGALESTTQFVIKLLGNRYEDDSYLQQCSTESRTDTFDDLECGSTYNLTVYFAHPNGNVSDCPVRNANGEITTSNSLNDLGCLYHFLIVLIPLSLLAFGVVILTIIGASCLCKKKKWCCWKQNGVQLNNPTETYSRDSYEKINE